MPFVEAKLEGDLTAGLDKLISAVEPVIYSGAAAMARVIYDQVLANTAGTIPGMPGVVTGNLHDSIYWAKDKKVSNKTLAVYAISWNRAKAPHGHLIEFGTSRAPAYPFVAPAAGKLPEAIKVGQARMQERFQEVAAGSK